MHYPSEIPFELGDTLQGTDDDGNLINNQWLGKKFVIALNNQAASGHANLHERLTGRQVVAVVLRNQTGFAVLPKRLVLLDATAGFDMVESVDGYAATLNDTPVAAVDPYLPAAGVADDDLFWGIIEGVTTLLTPIAGAGFNGDIAAGGRLVAATGTTSGTSDTGRVGNVTIANATDAAGAQAGAIAVVGRALSARTTGETNSDIQVAMNARLY